MNDLPEPVPCARADCAKSPAAHIGFMLGHLYKAPQPERQGLERASGTPRMTEEAFEQARENGRAFRAQLGTPRVMQFSADGQLQPVEPDPLAAVRPAEVQPAPPADATADEKCHRCGRPFDPTDKHFEGHGRYGDSPFCNSCVSACHDTEIADHWCAVDDWRNAPRSIRP